MDDKYIRIALDEAEKAYLENEIPVGSVIVKDNIILSQAHNCKESDNMVTRHAEIVAIENASKKIKSWRLDGSTIYITLFPCPMCAAAIQQARIDKIVYVSDSTNEELTNISLKILNNLKLNHTVEIFKINIESSILNDFFKKIRSDVSRETLE